MWPNAKISVMGGEQAAFVLSQVQSTESSLKKSIVDKYEHEGSAYFSSSNLWDDGVIMPTETREHIGFALKVFDFSKDNAQAIRRSYGIFRM